MGTVDVDLKDKFGIDTFQQLRICRGLIDTIDIDILDLLDTKHRLLEKEPRDIIRLLANSKPDLSDFVNDVFPIIFRYSYINYEDGHRLLKLFADRFMVVDRVGELKKQSDINVYDAAREETIMEGLCDRHPDKVMLIREYYILKFLNIVRKGKMIEFPIKIKVKANARENKIEEINNEYVVHVKEKAENNKANLAVIKLLSKFFNEKIYIKSGLRSKNKIIDTK